MCKMRAARGDAGAVFFSIRERRHARHTVKTRLSPPTLAFVATPPPTHITMAANKSIACLLLCIVALAAVAPVADGELLVAGFARYYTRLPTNDAAAAQPCARWLRVVTTLDAMVTRSSCAAAPRRGSKHTHTHSPRNPPPSKNVIKQQPRSATRRPTRRTATSSSASR